MALARSKKIRVELDLDSETEKKYLDSMPKKVDLGKRLTRRQQRDLDIEIGFMEGVVQRDPRFVEALQILGDDYTRRGKLKEGLKIDERLVRLHPHDPTMLYNLACSYALTRRYERAVASLSRAIERGYRDFKWLVKDPDLQGLRQHPLFQKIQVQIRSVKIKIK